VLRASYEVALLAIQAEFTVRATFTGGARRHPRLHIDVDGNAAERPQGFLRTSMNEMNEKQLN
jgi:hypothetical protein